MRHTKEEIRRMRNNRKKKKRRERSEKKKEMIIAKVTKEFKAVADQQKVLADQHRSLSSKYYRLWKRTVQDNGRLRERITSKECLIKYGKVNK